MKKVMKWILIVIVVIILIVVALLFYLGSRPAVPNDYQSRVKTGNVIEEKYLNTGSYEVAYKEIGAMDSFKKYEIFYPKELETSNGKYPVVLFSNGTGIKGSSYQAIQKHLASYGFITIANEEEYAWDAFDTEMSLRMLIKMNELTQISNWESNPFINKIDLDNIGVTGHSQGGVGAINAITYIEHKDMIKAAYIISPTNMTLASSLEWNYDASKIDIPVMVMCGIKDGDAKFVCPLEGLKEIYNTIPNHNFKMAFRRNDADHGDMLYFTDGYMTAFFMSELKNDLELDVIVKDIEANPLYQDIMIK